MKIGLALSELHRAESDLARRLRRAAERHKADHDIFHLGQDLAEWSEAHVRLIAEHACRYDTALEPDPPRHPIGDVWEKLGEAMSREPAPGMVLLADLREIYAAAAGVSVDWELIAQAAQGAKDLALIDLAQRCHPENLRQMRWANARLKAAASQILLS